MKPIVTMQRGERVVVAMSGGVDSSVAAARLHDAGYEVIGVTLHLWDYPEPSGGQPTHGRCCAPEDQYDARRVADALGFAHYTFDRRALFAATVVAPFVDAYIAGETPSPCSACNRGVKLAELFALADRLGARWVATGHYARIVSGEGPVALAMAADPTKDQSYFLYASPREWLERLVFPWAIRRRCKCAPRRWPVRLPAHKREKAKSSASSAAERTRTRRSSASGRRAVFGLGSSSTSEGRPSAPTRASTGLPSGSARGLEWRLGNLDSSLGFDAKSGTVFLGPGDALLSPGADLTDVTLAEGVSLPVRARVRVRYRHEGEAATVTANGAGAARVVFGAPVRAVTQGQTAVLYDGDRVLGGGRIASAHALG